MTFLKILFTHGNASASGLNSNPDKVNVTK